MNNKSAPVSLRYLVEEGFITLSNFDVNENGSYTWEFNVSPPYDKSVKQVIRQMDDGKHAFIEGFGQSLRIRIGMLSKLGVNFDNNCNQ